jgi:hypothetical protein
MRRISRRDFLKRSVCAGGAVFAAQMVGAGSILAGTPGKFNLNVGYLPISDHLILPVSHALDNAQYNGFNVQPYLCRSWDEILGKVDMGVLHAVFMPAPLAMYEVKCSRLSTPMRIIGPHRRQCNRFQEVDHGCRRASRQNGWYPLQNQLTGCCCTST